MVTSALSPLRPVVVRCCAPMSSSSSDDSDVAPRDAAAAQTPQKISLVRASDCSLVSSRETVALCFPLELAEPARPTVDACAGAGRSAGEEVPQGVTCEGCRSWRGRWRAQGTRFTPPRRAWWGGRRCGGWCCREQRISEPFSGRTVCGHSYRARAQRGRGGGDGPGRCTGVHATPHGR